MKTDSAASTARFCALVLLRVRFLVTYRNRKYAIGSVCLFVSFSVSRIAQKFMDGFA